MNPTPSSDDFPNDLPGSETTTGARLDAKVDEAAGRAHEAVDRLGNRIEPALQKAHDGIERASAALSSASDRLDEWNRQTLDHCRDRIRAAPLMSVSLAFAAGALWHAMRSR